MHSVDWLILNGSDMRTCKGLFVNYGMGPARK